MLSQDIKRKIDNARDTLVGKIPDPKGQIDQITSALIYKFMDDADCAAAKFSGGKARFFTGDLQKFAWHNLFLPQLNNQQKADLYVEGINKIAQAKHLPPLFRGIFKDAFVPFRAADTIAMFLDQINEFPPYHNNSEELGSAFEYLLHFMGTQGDAGQFRTPRHIIDFIVDIVAPTKTEKILDPACGTAGFLISAYKYIAKHNKLTPTEKIKLGEQIEGVDIDPQMAKIARVNLYLHGFNTPKIQEDDTLSNEELWGIGKSHVILANPPFMSPKGGIQPHDKFGIKANRSEVLFVDYIAEHLWAKKGRAGIIVPEGIIFQAANAYKALRKNLVENWDLFAVVSLPSGVFSPYSGVKTSILLLDMDFSCDDILFVKVENDGYDLGAQRRPIDKNDLPAAVDAIKQWKKTRRIPDKYKTLAHNVSREKIAEDEDYNLTGERYREAVDYRNAKWPMVELGEIAKINSGNPAPQNKALFKDGKYPFCRTSDVGKAHISDNLTEIQDYLNDEGIKGLILSKKDTILFPKSGASTYLNHRVMLGMDSYVSSHLATIYVNREKVFAKYLFYILLFVDAKKLTNEQSYPSLKLSEISKIKIPLPPLEIQKEVAAEIDAYQKVIDGAKQVIANWKPKIDIDFEWEVKSISEIAKLEYGIGESAKNSGEYRYVRITDITDSGELKNSNKKYIKKTNESKKYLLKKGDILVARTGATFGKTLYFESEEESAFAGFLMRINFDENVILQKYFWYFSQSNNYWEQAKSLMTGGGQPQFNANAVRKITVPIPQIEIQEQIIAEIESEQRAITECQTLITKMEQKIATKIAEVWDKDTKNCE